jgi:hypothetical protein
MDTNTVKDISEAMSDLTHEREEIEKLAGELYDIQQNFELLRLRPKAFDYEAEKRAFIALECARAEMHRADAALRKAQASFSKAGVSSRKTQEE